MCVSRLPTDSAGLIGFCLGHHACHCVPPERTTHGLLYKGRILEGIGKDEVGSISLTSRSLTSSSVDSVSKLKSQFTVLREELNDYTKFKEIYRFAFNFGKEPDQKILGA